MKRYMGPTIAGLILCVCGSAMAQQASGPCALPNSNLACVIIDEYGLTAPTSPFKFLTQGDPSFENVLNDVGGHPTHFSTSEFANSLSALNTAIGTQANLLPLASPSSGILLRYDPSLKTFVPTQDESLGPVLGERATTIGSHRLFLGFSYQYFSFDKIDGINLQQVPVVLTHTDDPRDNCPTGTCSATNNPQDICSINPANGSSLNGCGFIRDRIETQSAINLTESQYTAYVTFGLTRRIDVSAVIPFETLHMSLTTQAQIVSGTNGFFTPAAGSPDAGATSRPNNNQCTSTGGCVTNGMPYFFHTFKNCPNTSPPSSGPQTGPNYGLDPSCFNHTFPDPMFAGGVYGSSSPSNSVTGIGDVVARVKWSAWDGERAGVAVGLDVRFPTGNGLNFLGSGAYGYKPFVIFSYRARVSPHVSLGYEWNTNSITAGDLISGSIGKVPNEFFYTAGFDARVTKWLTGDFDVSGQRLFSSPIAEVTAQPFLANCGQCTASPASPDMRNNLLLQNGSAPTASYSVTYAAPGFKVRPIPGVSKLVFTGNALIRLDSMGLVSRVAPLVGVGYTF